MRTIVALVSLAFAAVSFSAPITTDSSSSALIKTCNRPGVFALTFDDGPNEFSWDLAKLLNANGVKATFFTNGYNFIKTGFNTTTAETHDGSKNYIEVLQLYDQLGHEVASHTYEHKLLVGQTTEEIEYQMNTQSDLIFEAIGKRPALMRPPEGSTDAVSDKVLKDLGYTNVLWDIDTKDYLVQGFSTQQGIIQDVVENDVSGETLGHISLQHDVHVQSATELTPWYIDYIKSKNYTFVTVSDCLGISAYQ